MNTLLMDKKINYHLIDISDPSEEFNLYSYKKKFIEAYNKITAQDKIPFLVGGTGMYLSSIIQDYKLKEGDFSQAKYSEYTTLSDEELKSKIFQMKNPHNITDFTSRDRMIRALLSEAGYNELSFPVKSCIIGVQYERKELKRRITRRLEQRLESGMVDEVKNLLKSGIPLDKLLFFGLEYKYLGLYVTGSINYNDMFQKLNSSIHAFAKRQMTWYRKMEKEGVVINWVEKGDLKKSQQIVKDFLDNVKQS